MDRSRIGVLDLETKDVKWIVDGGFFALSNNLGSEAMGTEYFRLVRGAPVIARESNEQDGMEKDLFAGIGA